jgi:hemerythrin-like domain-containing protein
MKKFFVVLLSMSNVVAVVSAEQNRSTSVAGHAHETAVEDLASEHGIVERILLIYEEMAHRLKSHTVFAADDLFQAADIVRRFVEDYHEKTEENYVFPVFEQKQILTQLTAELRRQHTAGRAITEKILELSQCEQWDQKQRNSLKKLLNQFVTMYRVHISREDTNLFPEFRKLVSKEEYLRLSTLFDEQEDELFGKQGYKKFLQQIEEIEKRLGIYDIALVTP